MPQIAIKRCHYSTVQHNEQCVTITDPGKGESLGIQTSYNETEIKAWNPNNMCNHRNLHEISGNEVHVYIMHPILQGSKEKTSQSSHIRRKEGQKVSVRSTTIKHGESDIELNKGITYNIKHPCNSY